ncbi:MAG: hypothetical protein AB8B70_11700, partial [Prochlorococcus sp.]
NADLVIDGSAPGIVITPSSRVLNEGDDFSFNIKLSEVATGENLYWLMTGSNILNSDFDGQRAGFISRLSDAEFSIVNSIANDKETEGDETLEFRMFSDADLNQQLGDTVQVLIRDTSTASELDDNPVEESEEVEMTSNGQTRSLVITKTSVNPPGSKSGNTNLVEDSENQGNSVKATLPAGVTLTSKGQVLPQSPEQGRLSVLESVDEATKDVVDEDASTKEQVKKNKQRIKEYFTGLKDKEAAIDVRSIQLTTSEGGQRTEEPIKIEGKPAKEGKARAEAFVIDTRELSSTAQLELDHIDFASILGPATITGGKGSSYVVADESEQSISLGADDDILYGGGGDDKVQSAGGADHLFGDGGDDWLDGGKGPDTVAGGTGSDLFIASRGDDLFYGNSEKAGEKPTADLDNLQLSGSVLDYRIASISLKDSDQNSFDAAYSLQDQRSGAEDGSDTLVDIDALIFQDASLSTEMFVAISTDDRPDQLEHFEVIDGTSSTESYQLDFSALPEFQEVIDHQAESGIGSIGEAAVGSLELRIKGVYVNGAAGDDEITGTAFADFIRGGAGADWIKAGAGDDLIRGGAGRDVII